jgi:hypothetical protein
LKKIKEGEGGCLRVRTGQIPDSCAVDLLAIGELIR